MNTVLIAFNNQPGTLLHDFFQTCGDEARQACVDYKQGYHLVSPPDLTEQNVVGVIANYQLCVIAAHGSSDAILNEKDEEVVSVKTTNYNFKGKGLYCISCCCADNLYPHLKAQGLKYFVGYNRPFQTCGDIEPFVTSAMSGLLSFLSGDTIQVAKDKMNKSFEQQIEKLDRLNPMAASFLLENKEALVFEGEENLLLSQLK